MFLESTAAPPPRKQLVAKGGPLPPRQCGSGRPAGLRARQRLTEVTFSRSPEVTFSRSAEVTFSRSAEDVTEVISIYRHNGGIPGYFVSGMMNDDMLIPSNGVISSLGLI